MVLSLYFVNNKSSVACFSLPYKDIGLGWVKLITKESTHPLISETDKWYTPALKLLIDGIVCPVFHKIEDVSIPLPPEIIVLINPSRESEQEILLPL